MKESIRIVLEALATNEQMTLGDHRKTLGIIAKIGLHRAGDVLPEGHVSRTANDALTALTIEDIEWALRLYREHIKPVTRGV